MTPTFPPLQPDKYRWSGSPSHWTRRTCGTETIAGIEPHNRQRNHELFLDIKLAIADDPVSLERATLAAVDALVDTRLHIPSVGLSWHWDQAQQCFLDYYPPVDDIAARNWATEHVQTVSGVAAHTSPDEACREILSRNEGQAAPALVVYILVDGGDDASKITRMESLRLMFHANHLAWDTASFFAMGGCFLKHLGAALARDPQTLTPILHEWTQHASSVPQLMPSVVDSLSAEQSLEGDGFHDACVAQWSRLMSTPTSWRLPYGPLSSHPISHTQFHTFNLDQSSSILRAVKQRGGPQATITHLVHAAIYLTVLLRRPCDDDQASLAFSSPVDGRRFLRPDYSSGQKILSGLCQTLATLIISDIHQDSEVLKQGECSPETKRLILTKTMAIVRQQYDEQLGAPCTLSAGLRVMETLGEMSGQKPLLSSQPGHASPKFASHGIIDRYIPHEVPGLTTQDVHFMVNHLQPALTFRLTSFRGQCRLSISCNAVSYSSDSAQQILAETVDNILVFC